MTSCGLAVAYLCSGSSVPALEETELGGAGRFGSSSEVRTVNSALGPHHPFMSGTESEWFIIEQNPVHCLLYKSLDIYSNTLLVLIEMLIINASGQKQS